MARHTKPQKNCALCKKNDKIVQRLERIKRRVKAKIVRVRCQAQKNQDQPRIVQVAPANVVLHHDHENEVQEEMVQFQHAFAELSRDERKKKIKEHAGALIM